MLNGVRVDLTSSRLKSVNLSTMASTIDWDMLAKYLAGECDEYELKKVETWLLESDDNANLLTELKVIFPSSLLSGSRETNSLQKVVQRLKDEGLM